MASSWNRKDLVFDRLTFVADDITLVQFIQGLVSWHRSINCMWYGKFGWR